MPVRFSYFCRKLRLHRFHYSHLNLANRANYFARMLRRQKCGNRAAAFDCGFYCSAILIKKKDFLVLAVIINAKCAFDGEI